jgi:hypothetical protein
MRAAAQISAELQPGSPADFAAFLARERAKWPEMVQRAGVKFNSAPATCGKIAPKLATAAARCRLRSHAGGEKKPPGGTA